MAWPVTITFKATAISLSVLLCLTSIGCNGLAGKMSANIRKLPGEIAGVWQAQDSPWNIVIGPDGAVSSVVIPMGEVEVRPNQTTKVEMRDGGFSIYQAGDCTVTYAPVTRELFVTVRMNKIHIEFMDDAIDGRSIDRFTGPVSRDGREWKADWITVFDYGPRFPQDPNEIFAQPLIFKKVRE